MTFAARSPIATHGAAALWRNLTNERRHNGLAFENLGFGTDGTYYAPLDAPLIVGLEVEAKF